MTPPDCDVAIIGAGTAGIAAERSARLAGAKTLLIDDRFAGTTCATVGCMPSKLLIAAATAIHGIERAPIFGIRVHRPTVDGVAVMNRLRSERDRFAASARESLEKLPEGTCIQARARFKNATTLSLDIGREVKARTIIIATGSKSSVPAMFETVKDRVLTNESIFELRDLPRSLAVVGAGPLGLELAQALHRLGVEIRVFDESPHLSGIVDPRIEQQVRSLLAAELPMTLGVTLIATMDGDAVRVAWSGSAQGSQRFEHVLVAAGRPPSLGDLDLQTTGLELDDHGIPRYERTTLQCGRSSIFIAGDADHDRPVLHEASAEGAIAGRNAARYPLVSPTVRYVALSIQFTDPQVAIVGTVPTPPAKDIVVGCASYADQGRAKVFACNAGLIHLYADPAQGRLRGASLCGPAVEHSAHLIAWAVQRGMTAADMLLLPFYHPTLEEGLKPALRSICEAVNASLDDSVAPGE